MAALKEVMEKLREKIASPPSMQGVTATYQFVLEGEGGGNYLCRFVEGQGSIEEGTAENPNVTITMQAGDFIDLVSGRLSATMAFMTGKLKISGDFGLALKLQGLLG
ncbi:SCP2 sterol-binding domain-containing protein [Desulfovirgula thermocuniculi]|uniref:SCP2 sterol-binding domain-containing protein n=1 Tax=Desulfovirgula thermocuniculi TaxID=348842 RepID=UPI00041F827C|nr:SCP2 sterol-binding domain-containing protein [Desulfovirgula thermocuniculi]